MPLVYTETVWQSLYRGWDAENQISVTYGDRWNQRDRPRQEMRRDWQVSRGMAANTNIIVIGCAFGFELEYLADIGFANVYGIDPSPYVWANTDQIRPDILPRIVNATVGVTPTAEIRTALAVAGMANPQRADWIVDADAISSQQDDAGINAFLDGCEQLLQGNARGRIIHLVTPLPENGPGDTGLLWKTMTDWKAYRPSHTWVDAPTLEVVP